MAAGPEYPQRLLLIAGIRHQCGLPISVACGQCIQYYVKCYGMFSQRYIQLVCHADWGLSHNSSTTLDHIVQSALNSTSPPLVLYAADYSYAGIHWSPATACSPLAMPHTQQTNGCPCCKFSLVEDL